MLHLSEEKILEDFVNEVDLEKGLKDVIEKCNIGEILMKNQGHILIGHDTRFSAQKLVDCFI